MIGILVLLLAASFTQAATERYIIKYDNEVWNSLHLNSLPDNTVRVLTHVKMTIADLSSDEISMYETIPGIKVFKDAPEYLMNDTETPSFTQNFPKNWGLDRIDQNELPLDNQYHFRSMGEGVEVYVIDTGVRENHTEFGGRAHFEKNFAGDDIDTDCNGHGTHVSSTIAGAYVGIAKGARIRGIKVLNCAGSGTKSNTIAGIDYVIGQHKENPNQKSVINMSLGGSLSEAQNDAVDAAVAAGVVVVVAAGNSAEDACTSSPASAESAITVAAAHRNDSSAWFTNYGKCVDIYAPGVDIYGAFIGNTTDYRSLKGTSMASPHVAGVVTLILSTGVATTPAEVKEKLLEVSSKSMIKDAPKNTPQNLLYADPAWVFTPKQPETLRAKRFL